jgi:hypothetical protein
LPCACGSDLQDHAATVAPRFFSGIPHPHLLGVRRRGAFLFLLPASRGWVSNRAHHRLMKDNKDRPEGISGRLADYFDSHKEEITNRWISRVRNDPHVPTGLMTKIEILDHLPLIIDAIVQALRQPNSGSAVEQLHQATVRHSIIRWIERFDLQAVIREVYLLRAEFIHHLRDFEEAHRGFDAASIHSASATIHRMLDDLLVDSKEVFSTVSRSEN